MFSLKKINTKNTAKAGLGRNLIPIEESYLSKFVVTFLTSLLVILSGLLLSVILSQIAIDHK